MPKGPQRHRLPLGRTIRPRLRLAPAAPGPWPAQPPPAQGILGDEGRLLKLRPTPFLLASACWRHACSSGGWRLAGWQTGSSGVAVGWLAAAWQAGGGTPWLADRTGHDWAAGQRMERCQRGKGGGGQAKLAWRSIVRSLRFWRRVPSAWKTDELLLAARGKARSSCAMSSAACSGCTLRRGGTRCDGRRPECLGEGQNAGVWGTRFTGRVRHARTL